MTAGAVLGSRGGPRPPQLPRRPPVPPREPCPPGSARGCSPAAPFNWVVLENLWDANKVPLGRPRPKTAHHKPAACRLEDYDLSEPPSPPASHREPGDHLSPLLASRQPVARTPKRPSEVQRADAQREARDAERQHRCDYADARARVREWQGAAAAAASACTSTLVWAQLCIAHAEQAAGRRDEASGRAAQLVKATAAVEVLRRIATLLGARFAPTLSWVVDCIVSAVWRTAPPPRSQAMRRLSQAAGGDVASVREQALAALHEDLPSWSGRGVAPMCPVGVDLSAGDGAQLSYMELYDQALVRSVRAQAMNEQQLVAVNGGQNVLMRSVRGYLNVLLKLCFRTWRGEVRRTRLLRNALAALIGGLRGRSALRCAMQRWHYMARMKHVAESARSNVAQAVSARDEATQHSAQQEAQRKMIAAELARAKSAAEAAQAMWEKECSAQRDAVEHLKEGIIELINRSDHFEELVAVRDAALQQLLSGAKHRGQGDDDAAEDEAHAFAMPPPEVVAAAEALHAAAAAETEGRPARRREVSLSASQLVGEDFGLSISAPSPKATARAQQGEVERIIHAWILMETAADPGEAPPQVPTLAELLQWQQCEVLIRLGRRLAPGGIRRGSISPQMTSSPPSQAPPMLPPANAIPIPIILPMRATQAMEHVKALLCPAPGPVAYSLPAQRVSRALRMEHFQQLHDGCPQQVLYALTAACIIHRAWGHLFQPAPRPSLESPWPVDGALGSPGSPSRRKSRYPVEESPSTPAAASEKMTPISKARAAMVSVTAKTRMRGASQLKGKPPAPISGQQQQQQQQQHLVAAAATHSPSHKAADDQLAASKLALRAGAIRALGSCVDKFSMAGAGGGRTETGPEQGAPSASAQRGTFAESRNTGSAARKAASSFRRSTRRLSARDRPGGEQGASPGMARGGSFRQELPLQPGVPTVVAVSGALGTAAAVAAAAAAGLVPGVPAPEIPPSEEVEGLRTWQAIGTLLLGWYMRDARRGGGYGGGDINTPASEPRSSLPGNPLPTGGGLMKASLAAAKFANVGRQKRAARRGDHKDAAADSTSHSPGTGPSLAASVPAQLWAGAAGDYLKSEVQVDIDGLAASQW